MINNAISSDDPNAPQLIRDRIAELEARQDRMRTANRYVRKRDRAKLADMGYSEREIDALFKPDFCGRVGYADFELQNNNANIRRLKQRLEQVEANAAASREEIEIGNVTIVQNPDANRTQILFPSKPDAATRGKLKARGFRWAPSEGAWQRHMSASALIIAREIVGGAA